MYFVLFSTLVYLSTCHCWTGKDDMDNVCGLLKHWLESASVSMEIHKNGFHRDVITTVEFSSDVPDGLKVVLVHRWPRGIYVDPYQLASLSDHSEWQILLGSAIDLEEPAHKMVGFVTLLYPTLGGRIPRLLKTTIPIHGRYHEPSFVGETFAFVNLEPPELLLHTAKCTQPYHLQPHTVVDAPCTAHNSSTCPWVKVQHQQEEGRVSFQLPVGDGSLAIPVCCGTLLVTMMCCLALLNNIWKHRMC